MSMGTNGYNFILKAPTIIQAVPHGQEEVVSIECPPAVEYAHHFKTIEELEGYCESLKYVPIQRPSENFIFTESADNYILQRESCPFCGRYFPSSMGSLDRGRHSFKICPFRPVKCARTGRILMAKDFLYLYMWMVDGIEDDTTDNLAGVWALSSAVKRDRYTSSIPISTPPSSRKVKTTPAPIINDEERQIAEANARLWEDATEAIARREKLALMEMEQRALLREREVEAERLKEREARIEALEREREALDLARRERAARMIAEERIERAEESARVWEEATDVLAKRESELLRDQERLQDRLQQEHRRAREVGTQARVIGPGSRENLERQSRTPPQRGKSGEYFRYRASSSPAQQAP